MNLTRFSGTSGDVSLTTASTAITLQQTSVNPTSIVPETVKLYSSVACTFQILQNATAAANTAASPVSLLPVSGAPSKAAFFTGSDAAGGQQIMGLLHLAAGEERTIDLSRLVIPMLGPGANLTIKSAAVTGTVNITLVWNEA